ncbi:MAG: ORF6N domain-containing protein [Opitutaceae bacterium]|nr:ORF6N domain-containing protein [Opitutaceae bacterium]
MHDLIPAEAIQQRILIVRGKRVLLDADLAGFYGVGTRELNRAVTRNMDRFPEDFAFKLTLAETQALMFQLGTSKKSGRGGTRKPATVFTEQGVAMLASVLRSPRAVTVSVAIVRAFVRLRELLTGNRELAAKVTELERKLSTHDGAIRELFAAIRQLLAPASPSEKREMGFHTRLVPTQAASRSKSRAP